MATFQAPKGTYDLIPPVSVKYLAVREAISAPLRNSGYGYIETPGFEDVGLFARGVGESTDIVSKEMYAFETKGGDQLALRPEGTASVLRAALEASLHKKETCRSSSGTRARTTVTRSRRRGATATSRRSAPRRSEPRTRRWTPS